MLIALLVILVILWALGFLPSGVNIPNITFFTINGHSVTFIDLLVLIIISWIVGLLPSPFRLIASILLVLWVLSVLGIFAFAGLSQWLVLTVIAGLVFYLIRGLFIRV